MKKIRVFISLFSINIHFTYLFSLKIEKRFKNNLKTSVIIPCHPKHACYLFPLLKLYAQQSTLPSEIIISLSESKKISRNLLKKIESDKWPFVCKLLLSEERLFAGQNRNKASENSSGDILIYQDADDIPHPQRVAIIKYFFDNLNIDHLMHLCTKLEKTSFKSYNPQTIPYLHYRNYKETLSSNLNTQNCVITNGNIALRKEIFQCIRWPSTHLPAEDTHFNTAVYRNFHRCIVLKVPLLIYRTNLSSWKNHQTQALL